MKKQMNIEYRTRNVEQQKFFKRNKSIFITSIFCGSLFCGSAVQNIRSGNWIEEFRDLEL